MRKRVKRRVLMGKLARVPGKVIGGKRDRYLMRLKPLLVQGLMQGGKMRMQQGAHFWGFGPKRGCQVLTGQAHSYLQVP
jgi:microcompartment protein CcmK/EutM